MATGLIYRTPGQYLAAAKRLPDGPARQNMLRQAALAYATANAARNGNLRGAASGIGALRGLGSTTARSDLQRALESIKTDPSIAQAIVTIEAAAGVAGAAVDVILLMTGNANDRGAQAALGWFRFLTGSRATPPVLGEAEIRDLANFVRSTQFLENPGTVDSIVGSVRGVVEGGSRILSTFGINIDTGTSGDVVGVVIAVVRFFTLFRNRLAQDPQIRRILEEGSAPRPDMPRIDFRRQEDGSVVVQTPTPEPSTPGVFVLPPDQARLFRNQQTVVRKDTPEMQRARGMLPPEQLLTEAVKEELRRQRQPKETGTSPLLWLGGAAAIGAVIYLMR